MRIRNAGREILKSNWWPVFAYGVMATWLFVINHTHLGLDFNFTADDFAALSQLDAIAHFTVALSVAAAFTPVTGRKWTLTRLLLLVVVWEIAEIFVLAAIRPDMFSQPGRRGLVDLVYVYDTLDDIALGTAGALLGVYLSPEASNTPKVLEKSDGN